MPLFSFIPKTVPADLKGLIKSIPEEKANMVSHAIGLLFFLIGVPLLIFKGNSSGDSWALIGNLIFGISLLMVYTSSTLYHAVYKLSLRKTLRVVDHICIYFLIAGSFSPFILVYLQTDTGYLVFGVLWLMVLVGSIFKYFFTHQYNLVATLAYVAMGCMSFFILKPLTQAIPAESTNWLILGGISYTIGVVFYLWKTLKFNHLIWHIFVLIGSISHFLAAWYL
ncbi:PAQR family membrane homeostasis protein TrhA [Arcticibacterium luteifluviistationis]|uniref:Hemolysin III n=1 Tax=Arcticibacterium luteifluviistationis TaxID=1784714 RepID=A0A2Z4GG93_9BACT|nr:hemolysin III family protein [Arcticibacterium luteifluviistationis]AWW00015.1 hemolysin III [Arcticibacterium luteifluviistationis]